MTTILYLNDGCPIPVQWDKHCEDDVKPWESRYVHRMSRYNELSRAAGNEIIGDDDVVVFQNLKMEDKIVNDKKVENILKVEDDSLRTDDRNIDLGVEWFKSIDLWED